MVYCIIGKGLWLNFINLNLLSLIIKENRFRNFVKSIWCPKQHSKAVNIIKHQHLFLELKSWSYLGSTLTSSWEYSFY